jgi:hypothetical protein
MKIGVVMQAGRYWYRTVPVPVRERGRNRYANRHGTVALQPLMSPDNLVSVSALGSFMCDE